MKLLASLIVCAERNFEASFIRKDLPGKIFTDAIAGVKNVDNAGFRL